MSAMRNDEDAVTTPPGAVTTPPGGTAESSAPRGRRRRRLLFVTVLVEVLGTVIARRAGYALGLGTLVRCNSRHVFTTIWIPGVSVKALRVGWWRVQWCPVGRHWTVVRPVREADLSEIELRSARSHRDLRLP